LFLFFILLVYRNFEGKTSWNFVWIPIAGSTAGLYNEWIIREGPLSRGQVKNSSKGVLKLATFVSWGYLYELTSLHKGARTHITSANHLM
jgi:hypothetical protein